MKVARPVRESGQGKRNDRKVVTAPLADSHWEHHGETEITNLVMLCGFHHHLLHRDSQWTVRIRDGIPEFIPPIWIDPNQIPRRKPPPTFAA